MSPFRDLTLPLSYFSPSDGVLIFHIPKSASTSLLWRIFSTNGYDPDELAASIAYPEAAWYQALWSQSHLVLLASVSEEARAAHLAASNVQKIAFVREPASRLWSAWVSKILVGEVMYSQTRDALYGPFESLDIGADTSRLQLAALFGEFVKWLPEGPLVTQDAHFMSQSLLLQGAPVSTQILESKDMDQHLRRLAPSLAGATVRKRHNTTHDLVGGPVMTRETYEEIERLYRADYDLWRDVFSWDYSDSWAIESTPEGSTVSEIFVERSRGARRLANAWELIGDLQIERDATVLELRSMRASRTWRLMGWWRRFRGLLTRVR